MIRALATVALVLWPSLVLAQNPPGPFGGLFGRTPERTGREFTALEFRNAFAAQYDDALFVDELLPEDQLPQSGYTGGSNASLSFQRSTDRTLLAAQGGATYQEFFRSPSFGATSYDASLKARGRVATRLQLEGTAQYARSPFFRLVPMVPLLPTAESTPVVIPGDPYAARRLLNQTYEVRGGFMTQYTRRSSLSASVSRRQTEFENDPANGFNAAGFDAQWRRQLNRDVALRAGFKREQIQQRAAGLEFVHEAIDLGLDLNRQLPVARRTTLGFNAQSSIVKRPETGRKYRLNGGATVTRLFGRTWHAALSAQRSTEFLPGFYEPLFSDNLSANVGGMLSARVDWFAMVSGARGEFGFDRTGRFATTSATTRLNFAMTRNVGFYTQYAFYHYKVPGGSAAISLLQQLSRQSFTAGVDLWVPIVNKVRAPRDSE